MQSADSPPYLKVVAVDASLIRNSSAGNPLHQRIHGCLQVNNEIRDRRLDVQFFVYLVVEVLFLGVEIRLGEKAILVEIEICNAACGNIEPSGDFRAPTRRGV